MQKFVETVAPWIVVLAAIPTVVVLVKKLAEPRAA